MKKDKNSLIYRMKGFAIWGVAVIHAATLSSYAAANNWAVLWHDFLPILSDIGVPIFFFLAGFLDHKKSSESFWCKRLPHLIIPWMVIGTIVWVVELIHFGSVAAFMPLDHFLLGYGSYLHFMRQIILLFILEFMLQQYPLLRIPSLILFIVSVFSDLTGETSLWKWMTSYCFALSSLLYFESGVICRLFSPSSISQRKLLFWDAACLAACLYFREYDLFPDIREPLIQLLKVGLVYFAMKKIQWNRLNSILERWGKNSYAIYLMHMPVAGVVYHFDPTGWLYPLRGIACVFITMIMIRILQWVAGHWKVNILSLFAIPNE